MTVMAPPNPRLPMVELVANRVCSERNPMPNGVNPTTWQHPETREETAEWIGVDYRTTCCVHCGRVVGVRS